MLRRCELIGQIQIERSAEKDIDHLHAAANTKHWHIELVGVAQNKKLEVFPFGRKLAELFRFFERAIAFGINVVAAGK